MYMLFSGSSYYPGGGMNDFSGLFPTIEAARWELYMNDWYHIVHVHPDGVLEIVESSAEYMVGRIFRPRS
jgi:hypothetical protein